MKKKKFIDFSPLYFSLEKTISNSQNFLDLMKQRRSIRSFSKKEIPLEVIKNIIATAATAPSGANKQPWSFCVVSSPDIKRKIRQKAEEVEKESYENRMSEEWLQDLDQFETNWHKPYIEDAPYIIILFKKIYDVENGNKKNNYYVNESVGIALGFLLTAIHQAGLVTVTHTPSPMNFLCKILNRPSNERAFMLLPVGYPAKEVQVPNIEKKTLEEIVTIF